MNTYTTTNSAFYLFKPRFPWVSLVLGAWLLTRGAMFFGILLLAFAASRIWRWYRGPEAGGPRVYFHMRRGGYHARAHREQRYEPLERVDEARVAAAEWREARVD